MDKQFISIEEMTMAIETMGNRNVWYNIEKISNCQERLAIRQLFFLSGGTLDD